MFVTTMYCLVLAAILLPEAMPGPLDPCNLVCPYMMRPVCGSDGKTYDNACALRRARKCENVKVKLVKKGACEEEGGKKKNDCLAPKKSSICRAMFPRWWYDVDADECKPFTWGGCGGNDNRYETKEECQNACVHPNGLLMCPMQCPNKFEPVCGSDKKDYDNFCEFQNAVTCEKKKIYMVHKGGCNEADFGIKGYRRCPDTCPNTLDPVCASDGEEYDNFCQFQVAAGCWEKDIHVVHNGRCTGNDKAVPV